MNDITQQSSAAYPEFRVGLCGAFRVEKRVGERYELIQTADWGGSNYPRLLLKALLCCPGRQARRDTLLDLLWPEADFEQATVYLNTATSKLRRLLRPANGQDSLLFTENDAAFYRLADQTLLWVDADEGVMLFKEAERRGRTSPEALPLLEQATTSFNRGSFLQDEEGVWAAGRRASVEQVRASCRLWLAEAYAHHGLPGQAVTVLQTLLEEDPLDEDVLARLMELLHRQGMTHQALRLYEQSCEVLAREELEPSEATRALADRLREERHTSSLVSVDFVTKKRNEPASPSSHQALLAHSIFQPLTGTPAFLQEESTLYPFGNGGITALAPFSMYQSLYASEMLEQLSRALAKPAQLDDAALLALETLVRDCWCFRPDILGVISSHLLQLVLGHLRHVTAFLSGSLLTSTRMRLCALASELTQIAGWTLYEMRAFSQSQAYYEIARITAHEAENPVLEAVALARMSRIFKYCAQEEAILPALQYARRLLQGQNNSPVYSWLCAEEALAYARDNQTYESLKTLEYATLTFRPENQEDDPYWVGFEENVKAGFFGSCYMALHQLEQAEKWYREALAQISLNSRINPNHRRSLLSVNLATILAQQEAIEEACQLATEALLLVRQSKSPLVLQHLVKFRRELQSWNSQAVVETFDQTFREVQTSLLQGSQG